jgi:hypothetical protein
VVVHCKFSSFGLHIFEILCFFRGSSFEPYRFFGDAASCRLVQIYLFYVGKFLSNYVTEILITENVLQVIYTHLPLPVSIFAQFISTHCSAQGRHLHLKLL